MWFLAFLAALTIVNARTNLPIEVDPRCKKMDNNQWQAFDKKEAIRKLAFARLGIPLEREFTEVLFGHETKTELNYNYFCAEGWNTVFEPANEIKCTPNTVNLIDKSNNAPGTVTINTQSGAKTKTTLTETDSLATAVGVSVKVSAPIPFVNIGVSAGVSVETTHNRTFGKEQTFETDTMTSISREIQIGPGNSNCTAQMTTTMCQYESQGKYPIVAVGWVGWRLKDEFTLNGEKARRWYMWIENFPRKERLAWGKLIAGIDSRTYSTVLSRCEESSSTTTEDYPTFSRSDNLLQDRHVNTRKVIPNDADELQSTKQKLSRAKASVPDHLKGKIMTVGNTLVVSLSDDD